MLVRMRRNWFTSTLLIGMWNVTSTLENGCQFLIKLNMQLPTIQPRNCTPRHWSQRNGNLNMHTNLHATAYVLTRAWIPRRFSGKESTCQCRSRGCNPWIKKILWRRKWQATPVFLPGKSQGQRSLATAPGVTKSWTRLSDWAHQQ